MAYGVKPLPGRGVDGRGETVVLPEFAETKPGALVTDMRPDMAGSRPATRRDGRAAA